MSRIGRTPIDVPSGVEVTVADRRVTVKGPRGTLERVLPGEISIRTVAPSGDGAPSPGAGATVVVERPNDDRHNRALHGLSRSLVNNMVLGVTNGFTKDLEIVGVGYRAIARGGSSIELALGFSHPVHFDAPAGVTIDVPAQNRISVKGIDKELVGQTAANIRKIRKPEPYKGKGVRYAGERVIRKAGKAAK
ncbi:MAG TPA: 50S ribosomal protein L6 [Acidimicrobiales bacterium]|jgi:large subunit ribosomal protein L6|nr:50S ribosomal protein L6 [Acidimicrobiales bacterium]